MKTSLAIQCMVLLACMAFCSSQVIPKCRCLKTIKRVKHSLITGVQVYDPRPYCNKREVIVTLKGESKQCLDPESQFTKLLLEKKKELERKHTTVSLKTPTAAPTA